ncbi:MAG: siphovirus Gp157 family protein [Eubacteriales bacterium]|nr:siphovirus Gp157 family protein [Eubacteriales bacterium]
MSTLFELKNEYEYLYQMATECGPEDAEIFADTMEAIQGEIEEKADGYAYVIAQIEGDRETIKAEIARLTQRQKALEANGRKMKEHLQQTMVATGNRKFKTATHSFSIQKNPVSVKIDNEAEIPDEFMVPQEPKVNKKAIAAFLKSLDKGDTCTFAHLEETEGLRIR